MEVWWEHGRQKRFKDAQEVAPTGQKCDYPEQVLYCTRENWSCFGVWNIKRCWVYTDSNIQLFYEDNSRPHVANILTCTSTCCLGLHGSSTYILYSRYLLERRIFTIANNTMTTYNSYLGLNQQWRDILQRGLVDLTLSVPGKCKDVINTKDDKRTIWFFFCITLALSTQVKKSLEKSMVLTGRWLKAFQWNVRRTVFGVEKLSTRCIPQMLAINLYASVVAISEIN